MSTQKTNQIIFYCRTVIVPFKNQLMLAAEPAKGQLEEVKAIIQEKNLFNHINAIEGQNYYSALHLAVKPSEDFNGIAGIVKTLLGKFSQ